MQNISREQIRLISKQAICNYYHLVFNDFNHEAITRTELAIKHRKASEKAIRGVAIYE